MLQNIQPAKNVAEALKGCIDFDLFEHFLFQLSGLLLIVTGGVIQAAYRFVTNSKKYVSK